MRVDTNYMITEEGSWLAALEPPAPYVSSGLFARVAIARVAIARVVIALVARRTADGYLDRQREAHLARMRELTARKSAPDASIAEVLAADYAIQHLDADLRWMETTGQRLADLTMEIRR